MISKIVYNLKLTSTDTVIPASSRLVNIFLSRKDLNTYDYPHNTSQQRFQCHTYSSKNAEKNANYVTRKHIRLYQHIFVNPVLY